ncbi:MAG: 4-hydroxybutyryl-CoA dehydratase [Proteobacteria bacterium]|nr:4-hydroxybutyryl-CoA dehydratase [Pseudomonadota bacterium]
MRTAAQYLDSLRTRDLRLFVDGERVPDATVHPKVLPSIRSVALTYALAHDPEHAALATAPSELVGGPVNRFTHLFAAPEDLVRKIELQRILGRASGTCFQRCVGMDALNALFIATWEAGPDAHGRFVRWMTGVQERDDMLCGAMTDPKGDRRKRPPEQPEQFLRVVDRRDGGVVLRGAKMHQTGAANSHQIVVMPGGMLREGEEDFAIAAAMPVDAPGITMVLGRQPSDDRKGGPDAGNRFGGQEVVVLFDDVFVPAERVFLDGDVAACATLLEAFAGYHRASYGGCKPGNFDAMVGAVAAVTDDAGTRRASHVRDKLVEMIHLAETIHGVGLAASSKSTQHGCGTWQVDPVLANCCKHNVTRLPYEIGRIAEDLSGGLLGTMPSIADLDHPEFGEALTTAVGGRDRAHLLRLVENMTYGAGAVALRLECMHGAGSPAAQRIVLERHTDWAERMAHARRLAGLPE